MRYLFLILVVFLFVSCGDNEQGVNNSCTTSSECRDGKECFQGACISTSEKCSETKLDGYCLDDKLCLEGVCVSKICNPNPCTDEHKTVCSDVGDGSAFLCSCSQIYHE